MNIDRFTEKAQQAIASAQRSRFWKNMQQIDGEHLHLALLTQEEGWIPKLLPIYGKKCFADHQRFGRRNQKIPRVYGAGAASVYATQRFNKILLDAEDISKRLGKDEYTGVEHLYLALLNEKGTPSQRIFQRTVFIGKISW